MPAGELVMLPWYVNYTYYHIHKRCYNITKLRVVILELWGSKLII